MRTTLLLALGLLLTGCGIAIRAGADYRPGTSLETYRTFGWGPADDMPTGDARLDNNTFFHERIKQAIAEEMTRRGFTYSERAPDLLLHYHASVRERVDVYAADEELGYSSEYGPGTQVVQYDEGTLLVDIARADGMHIIWRGWAQGDLGSVIDDPEALQEQIRESVRLMFDRLPT